MSLPPTPKPAVTPAEMEASVLQGRRLAAERRFDAWELGEDKVALVGEMKQHDYDIVVGAKSRARTGVWCVRMCSVRVCVWTYVRCSCCVPFLPLFATHQSPKRCCMGCGVA